MIRSQSWCKLPKNQLLFWEVLKFAGSLAEKYFTISYNKSVVDH